MLKKIGTIAVIAGFSFNSFLINDQIHAKINNNELVQVQQLEQLPVTGALSAKEIIKKVGINRSKNVDTHLNEKNFLLAGSHETDISYWTKILPTQDQNKDHYIVLPTQGLVMPLNTVSKNSRAYNRFINGEEENFIQYLNNGAVEIPATSKNGYGQAGNKVIAGHSSYFYTKKARYRTHFQKIIGMEKNEEVWIYEKDKNTGNFTRYVYKVNESYETDDEDVSILAPTHHSQVTLFTCTPIGGISGRWIVKAHFVAKF